ncbi:MAG: hypothetical protein RLY16_113, partial [Bacteroidota bacterium]
MNFLETPIESFIHSSEAKSIKSIYRIQNRSKVRNWLLGILFFLIIVLFLPWTQHISSKGMVTTLRQEQRPQELNTVIAGKVVKWHIKEGDFVNAGDTIMQLSEVKVEYLDPNLLGRTQEQLQSKQLTIDNYKGKVGATDQQIVALQTARELKLAQLENKIRQQRMKVQSDSMEMLAANNDFKFIQIQFGRQQKMYDSGLISLTQLEQRNMAFQNAQAKKTSAEIKWMNARQELGVLQLELNGVMQDYNEKLSKASGDRFQSMSQIATGEGEVAKLQNQYMNYDL